MSSEYIDKCGELIMKSKKYDDTPLYEINKYAPIQAKENAQSDLGYVQAPKHKWWNGKTSSAAYAPSPLYSWYHTEDAKRSKGELNEIDMNEINAATKGAKNIWLKAVIDNKSLAEEFLMSFKDGQDKVRISALWHNMVLVRKTLHAKAG